MKNPGIEEIRKAVLSKYADVARSAEGKFNYPTGRKGTEMLGYVLPSDMEDSLAESFCGVGNPFSLGPVHSGDHLLDVGCGAGFDLVYAGHLVGKNGRVCGIDITPEMVERARRNISRSGITHWEIRLAGSESIPYGDAQFDVAISNGVLNLSPQKEKCFQEIYRVLKQGGYFQFADIILKQDLPPDVAGSPGAWSD